MKENVLIVHNYYQIPGGEDTVVENERKMLEENGHKVILYTRNNNELRKMPKFKKILLPFTTIFNIKTYRHVKKIIKENQIDVVHVHNTLNLISPSVYYAALSCKVPVVQTVHNFRLLCPAATFYRDGHICEDCVNKGLKCAIKHNCYRNSKIQTLACVINTKVHRFTGVYGKINYICLTEFNREKLLKLKQVKPEKIFIKPNFVSSIYEFIPREKRKNQFIFVGRLDKLKGVDLLINAWKKIKNIKLIICGTGPLENWIKEYIDKNHMTNVELKGFVRNGDAIRLIAESKALILPTQWYEGFPMTAIESFSVGTPVICSDLGNIEKIVEEEVNGFKFSYNSINDLIMSIKKCIDNKDIYLKTYYNYCENYNREINYNSLINIYKKVKK